MKMSEKELRKLIREEVQNDEQLDEIFGFDLKAGLAGGKQEFAYRRAVSQVKNIIKSGILPVFQSLLATRKKLEAEEYDFPQVEKQFDATLETVKKMLNFTVPKLPKEDQEVVQLTDQIKQIESEMAQVKASSQQGAEKAAAPAEKAAAPAETGTAPAGKEPDEVIPGPGKRDDLEEGFFGDLKAGFSQGKLAAKSAEYIKNLRASVDKIKPALLNMKKLDPVLDAQKAANANPVAVKKQKAAAQQQAAQEEPWSNVSPHTDGATDATAPPAPGETHVAGDPNANAEAETQAENKKPLTYNKLYENWRRFSKG